MTLFWTLATLVFLVIGQTMTLIAKEYHMNLKGRINQVLCAYQYLESFKKSETEIDRLNKLIEVNAILSAVPKAKAAQLVIIKSLQGLQQLHLISFLKNNMTNKYCTYSYKLRHATNFPYQLKGKSLFVRDSIGKALKSNKEWKIAYKFQNFSKSRIVLSSALNFQITLITRKDGQYHWQIEN